MDETTRALAQFVARTEFGCLPPQAVHECKRRLIDSIACAAAAYPEPFSARVRDFSARYGGTPAARIWGSGVKTSIEMAAFANGSMLRYLDCSDTYLGKAAGHPSDMIGALVAAAEAFKSDGASLVTATVVAYEVYCGLCASVALQNHAIDQATCAAVGTAAGAARLFGLSEEQIGHALSLSLAPNLHLYNVRCGTLSDWKACAGPNGARNGVFGALLARDGFTGPSAVVEGKGGLREATAAFEWSVDNHELPLIVDTHLKYHPVCYHGQAAVDAAAELHSKVDVDEIAEICVETYEAAVRVMAGDAQRWAPATRETADHSLPYTIAVTLLDGHLAAEAYEAERLHDRRVLQLMEKIRVSSSREMSDAYPERVQARIVVRKTDGSTVTHLQPLPKGHARNPLSDRELEDKFAKFYRPFGDARAARRALEVLWSVERLPDAGEIVDAACLKG